MFHPTAQVEIHPRTPVPARVLILGNIITAAIVYALLYGFAAFN